MLLRMATKTKLEIRHPLPGPLVERVAERFRVLGEPMRIRLLEAMRDGEISVRDLQEATGASQQNVSQHLSVLLRAGIIGRRKEGNFSLYSITDPVVFTLCDEVCGGLRRQVEELDTLLEAGRR
jgi:DNA-binding transcriptional ArsR family regulator